MNSNSDDPSGAGAGKGAAPSFDERDCGKPAFWDERFAAAFTPWDNGGVGQAFVEFARAHERCDVLIPGCGTAYEARWLAARGWRVEAIDFSPAAVEAARALFAEHGGTAAVVREADFFDFEPLAAPRWIYERAFLCALPIARRVDYARRMAELLPRGAVLAGFFFMGATQKGPPFGIDAGELDALLTPFFEPIENLPVADSLPVFDSRERWMTWQRR